jgi:hypothetical protein
MKINKNEVVGRIDKDFDFLGDNFSPVGPKSIRDYPSLLFKIDPYPFDFISRGFKFIA